jgi:hypothetical protein
MKKQLNLLERVISFETACSEVKKDSKAEWYSFDNKHVNYKEVCGRRLEVISEAIRQKDIIDIYDHSQKKYRGWFETTTDGTFRFYCVSDFYRLVDFPSWTFQLTEAKAEHLFSHPNFLPLWRGYLTGEK